MPEKQANVITFNGTDYTEDQLTDHQKVMINHIGDLERKICSSQFSLDQLNVGREAFVNILTASYERNGPVPEVWATYRQALRDVPQQPGFPTDVLWPTEPENV